MSSTVSEQHRSSRVSLSEVVRLLLERQQVERSTVSLTRNAKGETQIEVTVRTAEDGSITTVAEAEAVARDVYDRLRARYPMSDGRVGAGGEAAAS